MTKQGSGLRFDIYERVQLSEDLDGIENFDNLELTPEITLESAGDQAVLKGHLLLHGNYTGFRSQQNRLEHRIPVEIIMPKERIDSEQNVGVEIEHFDIDLLSSRMLNVTGVLTLKGLKSKEETNPTHEAADWSRETDWSKEEKLFVHEAPVPEQEAQSDRASPSSDETASDETASETLSEAETVEETEDHDPASESSAEESLQKEETSEQSEASTTEDSGGMKISFSGKKTDNDFPMQAAELQAAFERETTSRTDADQPEHDRAGAENILNQDAPDDRSHQDAVQATEPDEKEVEESDRDRDAQHEKEESNVSGVQWKHLFLSQESEDQRFRRVRMCIVQKEETLETIAARYDLNPREILLYNRLGDQPRLTEGQVLYIPDAR